MSYSAPLVNEKLHSEVQIRQQTLLQSISINGRGLFTGEEVSVRLCPAPAHQGIVFKRVDLSKTVEIPAKYECLKKVSLPCTTLGKGEVVVQTVEHLLAALRACAVDNITIEISGPEVPILDGSALPFVEMICQAGLQEQDEMRQVYQLKEPLFWSKGDVHLIALPDREYRITYTLHYPHSKVIGTQYFSLEVNKLGFQNEIAACRTFSLYEEVQLMIEKGMIKGSLDNGVVIGKEGVLNQGGLRMPSEMVRHKILDLIGDLSLTGVHFLAHIIAIRSGHASNCAFGIELLKNLQHFAL